jgi:hypothetical protein
MSDETKHPERRAGQRIATGYGCTYGDRPGGPWCPAYDEGEDGWKLWNDGVSTGMKAGEALCPGHADAPAAPQPSAPVVACKAPEWRGMPWEQRKKNAAYRALKEANGGMACDLAGRGLAVFVFDKSELAFCSPACRDAKHPPLAAPPGEAKRVRLHVPPCYCADCGDVKPAEQPKPAKGHDFSDPYCARRYEGAVVRLCVACGAFDKDGMRSPGCELIDGWRKGFEGWVGETAQAGKPYTGPERIAKPPMAHSSQWADEAEDA